MQERAHRATDIVTDVGSVYKRPRKLIEPDAAAMALRNLVLKLQGQKVAMYRPWSEIRFWALLCIALKSSRT